MSNQPPNKRRHGPPSAFGNLDKPSDLRGTLMHIIRYIGGYRLGVLAVIIFALCSTLFSILGPKILGLATTSIFTGLMSKLTGTGSIDFGRIGTIALTALALYLVSAAFSFLQRWIMSDISQKICYRLRREIAEKIDRMPMKYFESHTVGDVLSRITNDVDTFGQGLNQSITQVITSVTTVIGILIIMLTISPLMTLIAAIVVPLSAFFIVILVKVSQKYFKAQQDYLGLINGKVEETFSGQNVVKAFNREEAVIDEFRSTNDILYTSSWKSQFLSGLLQPLMTLVGNLGYVGVAVSGSLLAIRGVIQVGDIQAFIQYVKNLTQPIQTLAQVSSMLQSMAASAERVFTFLGEEEESPEPAEPASTENIRGDIQFHHVKFGYDEDKPVIHDFSSSVKAGQTVALVGPTGAGKTTIVKLLMRFYDVNSGSITIDGTDIRDFTRADMRRLFGMVLQDTWLFKGTIMENIRYGRTDATDEEVMAAAGAANAAHFIETLPGGYQMELNEEITNISQGEKQLLTIARAILANNRIMILDEATSSVDTRTEMRIQEAMSNLTKGRTSFVIAHRLSTIRNADLILVINDGDIVEQGRHEELLAAGGFYAELYNSQFEE